MALLNIYCFVTATCLPQFFFKGKKRNRKLIMKIGNPSHYNLIELTDPQSQIPLAIKDTRQSNHRFLKSMQVVPPQSSCFTPGTSPVSEEIRLNIPWSSVLCDRWCCVSRYLVPSSCLCFSIICIKAERFSQLFMLPVYWFPWVLMERYPIFKSVFQNKFWFTHLFTYTANNEQKPWALIWQNRQCG